LGNAREEVIKSEDAKPFKDEKKTIAYIGTLEGRRVLITYQFTTCCLAETAYALLDDHSNKNNYIDDFDSFKRRLVSKYGAPETDAVRWRDPLYKDDAPQYGLAVSVGHLQYDATWETKNTDVSLLLRGDNYEVHLLVTYSSKIFGPILAREEQEEGKSQF
jgi:hypothetical protein